MKKVISVILGLTLLFNGSVIHANTSDDSLKNNSLIDDELEEELKDDRDEVTEVEEEEESGNNSVEQDTQNNDSVEIQSENENAEVVENSDGSVTIKTSELNMPSAVILGIAIVALIGVLVFWKPKK